ncbi:hypothetical protein TRFO_33701 [Tritrichomonas foetus]|uniref:Uncharacterized protein n=1 Tax=Tritrichomonas foetus TaxID=1144522 RepID=A0A1J4JL12_9EUKA|nr:hypothetical protein TRFO_33701 [Tritrichomonas foetus]|eukprot:OHS99782.1 hypothetical protein TRFO_33701 [Tritrichomonas foetus]
MGLFLACFLFENFPKKFSVGISLHYVKMYQVPIEDWKLFQKFKQAMSHEDFQPPLLPLVKTPQVDPIQTVNDFLSKKREESFIVLSDKVNMQKIYCNFHLIPSGTKYQLFTDSVSYNDYLSTLKEEQKEIFQNTFSLFEVDTFQNNIKDCDIPIIDSIIDLNSEAVRTHMFNNMVFHLTENELYTFLIEILLPITSKEKIESIIL